MSASSCKPIISKTATSHISIVIQGVSKLMRNILKVDFSAKIKGGLSYNFLFTPPPPPSYDPLKLREKNGLYLIYPLWKNLS